MSRMRTLIILLMSVALLPLFTQAEDNEQKAKRIIDEFFVKKNKKGLLVYEEDKGFKADDPMTQRVVFIQNGLRYTIFWTGEIKEIDGLSFWVRKDGTTGPGHLITFSDHNLDGIVDFGVGPKKLEKVFFPEGEEGEEHREHWQKHLDKAYSDTIEFIDNR